MSHLSGCFLTNVTKKTVIKDKKQAPEKTSICFYILYIPENSFNLDN